MEKILDTVEPKITVEIAGPIEEPKEFFQDRKGLYVWSSFKNNIVLKAEKVPMPFAKDICSFKLTKSANDKEIETELPEKHLFSENELCAILTDLIFKQPKGEEGTLLNNGNWNLFYTESFVVCVHWSSVAGGWRVSTWGRADSRWYTDERVFSPTTEL